MSLNDVDAALVKELSCLAPHGPENRKPIFLFKAVTPLQVEVFGRAKEHTKLIFATKNGPLEAICFFKQPPDFTQVPTALTPLTLLAQAEESWFMNRHQIRLRIVDIV